MTLGIALSGAITSSMWQPMTLVFTALLSMLVCGTEELTLQKSLGVLSGLVGAAWLFLDDPAVTTTLTAGLKGPSGSVWGHLALFVSTLASGYFAVLRRQMHKRGVCGGVQLRVATWTQLFSIPLLLLAGVVAGSSDRLREHVCAGCDSLFVPPEASGVWASLIFYAVVPSAFCQTALAWASQRADPSTLAMYTTLQPAISAVMTLALRSTVPWLKEILATPGTNLLGGVPITLGLWLVSSKGGGVKKER
jgi:drug/metabolite transporter (DMT)-like permease